MPGAVFALGLGMVLLIPLIVIALARIEEIAAIAFGRKPLRLGRKSRRSTPDVDAESLDPRSRA